MNVPALVLIVSVLMVVVTLAEPLARRLLVPPAVVLAGIGAGVGVAAGWALFGGMASPDDPFVRFFADPPISSAVFLYVFLPILLFNSALGLDVSEMAGDAVPILMLAVIAVLTATAAIAVAVWPFAGIPLVGCLLFASVVATTDPVAVIGIFREVGAPERLVRLVEGESLLNDAAAVTLFVVFTALTIRPDAMSGAEIAVDFLVMPFGGALVGWLGGRVAAELVGRLRDGHRGAVSISLALPFAVYVASEQIFHLSGVVAVVVAGLVLAREGPSRLSPQAWQVLRDVWGQLDHWAAAFLFILASMLMPRLLAGTTPFDLVVVGVVVVAATAARALIVHGILPLLERAGWSPPVSGPYRAVIVWGGLRGATTLALALAVTENPAVPEPVARAVAVLSTGYTLFTLLVQGTTLRPLMRSLKLDRLTPVDEVVRDEALAVAYGRAAARLERDGDRHGLARPAAEDALADLEARRAAVEAAARSRPGLSDADRVALALVAASRHEHDRVLDRGASGVIPPGLVGELAARARALVDAARLGGEAGWRREAEAQLGFDWRDRLAHGLHRRLGVDAVLAHRLERRLALLLATRVVQADLDSFARDAVLPLAGAAPGERVAAALEERFASVGRAIRALHLQYPDYAEGLERAFMRDVALSLEEAEIRAVGETGLVNAEVEREIVRTVERRRAAGRERLRLDLGLDTRDLVAGLPLFADLPPSERDAIAAMLRPVFAYPGEIVMRRGGTGDAAYFISSGAVEADTGAGLYMIGRGGVFGEMSLITGRPRSATVRAAAYCAFLRLSRRDYDAFMRTRPAVRRHVEALAEARSRVNAAALGQSDGEPEGAAESP